MPFVFEPLAIPDVVLVRAVAFSDDRGFFAETFRAEAFAASGIDLGVAQLNHSRSRRGVLRGLHFQRPPMAQGKLVWCARGEIFDVAVDLRAASPTRGRWVGETLSDDNHAMLWIPPGFAHGFLALSERADVVYATSAPYSPEHDTGIRWDDPAVGVAWPTGEPTLSAKDAALPLLADAAPGF